MDEARAASAYWKAFSRLDTLLARIVHITDRVAGVINGSGHRWRVRRGGG